MRIANRETVGVCPKCGGTLRHNGELNIWKCTAARCQWSAPSYTAPKQEPDPLLCPTCKRVLEQIEADANDPYHWYCDECDTCYNAALEKEPPAPKDKFCPRCKRVLLRGAPRHGADLEPYWFCARCDHYLTPEDFPQQEKEPMRCKYCQHVLEYDETVRDSYKWWCSGCNATFDDNNKPQPGMYIWVQVPFDEPALDVSVNHVEQLEAVAAAAVALFTRHGKELHYMPGSKTRNDLQHAVVALLSTGWRPK